MLEREKKRPIKNFPKKASPGGAARKLPPSSEVAEVRVGRKSVTLEGSVVVRLKEFLARELGSNPIPWREALKDTLAKGGEPAAMLRGARAKAGLTQAQLADQVDTAQANIAAMESGGRPIGKDMAKRLGAALKVDYRVFL